MYAIKILNHDTTELYEAMGIPPNRCKELSKICLAAYDATDNERDMLLETSKYANSAEELTVIILMNRKIIDRFNQIESKKSYSVQLIDDTAKDVHQAIGISDARASQLTIFIFKEIINADSDVSLSTILCKCSEYSLNAAELVYLSIHAKKVMDGIYTKDPAILAAYEMSKILIKLEKNKNNNL